MTPIHEQLYRFIINFRRNHDGLVPDKIRMYIDDYGTLIGTHHDEAGGLLQFNHRSPSIYEGTFMGIPIKVSVYDTCIRITGVYEHEGEVLEDYELESVEG